jgi:hypothetical protein
MQVAVNTLIFHYYKYELINYLSKDKKGVCPELGNAIVGSVTEFRTIILVILLLEN